ncbi:MAG TPA: hypothetical protein VIT21_06780 [Chthoniobacterales bacterium]
MKTGFQRVQNRGVGGDIKFPSKERGTRQQPWKIGHGENTRIDSAFREIYFVKILVLARAIPSSAPQCGSKKNLITIAGIAAPTQQALTGWITHKMLTSGAGEHRPV